MSKHDVKVKLQIRGINKVMRGAGAQRTVNEAAYRLASRAGAGHEVVPAQARPHRWVARAYVQQEDAAQARTDPDGLVLLRAVALRE